MMPVSEVLADWPSTAIVVTRVRPIIRAEAVAAVRRGLRVALVSASAPTWPNIPR